MPKKPWAMASEPNVQNQALSPLTFSTGRGHMRKSSENVAAIATALAKAQIELSNPAKSMLGSVYPGNIHESPKNFRYAPLSGGLEIIRKALGGQQIAVTQTTEID